MFSKMKNIVFDLDGTLIDSSEGVIEATNYALVSLKQSPRSASEIKRFIGHPLETMFASFCDAPVEPLKARFQERARLTVVASAHAMPGTDEVLPLLVQAGFRLAIATTKYAVHTTGTIKKLGWESYFAALASGDEVEQVKPAPDLVFLALQRLGAVPGESVMVGDTINDILAARAAGIRVISVKSPFGGDDLGAHQPDMLFDDFNQLRSVFKV
jgi:phosphoglycolate phosphatase